MEAPSPLQQWYDRHKDKITWGMILYLFGTNQAQQADIKKSDASSAYYRDKYIQHIEAESLEKSRALFRRLLDSDTTFILSADTVAHAARAHPLPDAGK